MSIRLPTRDVLLADGRRLRHKGETELPGEDEARRYKHPLLEVIASLQGGRLHISLSHPDRSSPTFGEAALVALAFGPGLDLHAREGLGKRNVIHLLERAAADVIDATATAELRERLTELMDRADPGNRSHNKAPARGSS